MIKTIARLLPFLLHPSAAREDFRRDLVIEKVRRHVLWEFRRQEKITAEKLRKAELFAGMEMADFDLTRRNLITLRTGLCGSETRNEASRRSRDDNVKVRYKFHRRSFPSKDSPICRYSEKDRQESSLILYLWQRWRRQKWHANLYPSDHIILKDGGFSTDSAMWSD